MIQTCTPCIIFIFFYILKLPVVLIHNLFIDLLLYEKIDMKGKFYITRVNERPNITCHKDKVTAKENA